MKVAVISDIHGNSDALKQMLEHAKLENVEKLLVLGDLVGYYYHPDLVLNLLDKWDYVLIRGNHEVMLKEVMEGILDINVLNKKYGSGHQFALDKLSKEQLNQITLAPDQKEIVITGTKILLCHGSNWDPNCYLYPDTKVEILNKSGQVKADFVFIGHSHYSFVHENQNNMLINVGSVGQSRKHGGVAEWGLLNSKTQEFRLMKTKYNVKRILVETKKTDPDNLYLQTILKRNNEEI